MQTFNISCAEPNFGFHSFSRKILCTHSHLRVAGTRSHYYIFFLIDFLRSHNQSGFPLLSLIAVLQPVKTIALAFSQYLAAGIQPNEMSVITQLLFYVMSSVDPWVFIWLDLIYTCRPHHSVEPSVSGLRESSTQFRALPSDKLRSDTYTNLYRKVIVFAIPSRMLFQLKIQIS